MYINREKINKIADTIREALELIIPPYDPSDAIKKLDGKILYDVFDNDIDAFIEKREDLFVLHLNPQKPNSRERFSIAHELGHLFLHMGYLIDQDKWKSFESRFTDSILFRSDNYSSIEYEANEFAAAFLMPKEEFIIVAEENLDENLYYIESIAKYFQVSTLAASNRGKWLGLFEW